MINISKKAEGVFKKKFLKKGKGIYKLVISGIG